MADFWQIIGSIGTMIGVQLFIQIIAWVKFTARIDTRLSILETKTESAIKAFEAHEVLDSSYHKAAWERIDSNTIALAKAGLFDKTKS